MLPKSSVEFQPGPVPLSPVAAMFALVTLAMTLTANSTPVLQSVLTGNLSKLADSQYHAVAAPGPVHLCSALHVPCPTHHHAIGLNDKSRACHIIDNAPRESAGMLCAAGMHVLL